MPGDPIPSIFTWPFSPVLDYTPKLDAIIERLDRIADAALNALLEATEPTDAPLAKLLEAVDDVELFCLSPYDYRITIQNRADAVREAMVAAVRALVGDGEGAVHELSTLRKPSPRKAEESGS